MSANNWSICPKCKAHAEATKKKLLDAVETQYGELPKDEYRELVAEANKPISLDESLREDWEISICEDGRFFLSYSGICNACDFRYIFKHEENALEAKPKHKSRP